MLFKDFVDCSGTDGSAVIEQKRVKKTKKKFKLKERFS
jgi:hypothetical protein